jgi:molybdopterin molybdotransferase
MRPFKSTISLDDARRRLAESVRPITRTERVALAQAAGRVAAADIASSIAVPPFARSAMDGYAVMAADLQGAAREAPIRLRVIDRLYTGQLPERPVVRGTCAEIATGAPLPEGADAVVMVEETARADDDRVDFFAAASVGQHIGRRGADISPGDLVVRRGELLNPSRVGAVAAIGCAEVQVYARPRVAVLSTGNEVADLGSEPAPGQIPNANTYALLAQARQAGAEAVSLGVAPDRLDAIEERVRWGLTADVLVSSAGVSVGELDVVREALTRAGAELHLWRVAMRPGKPITFGSLGRRLVFGLPGNPVSAMVTVELFVRPALLTLAGLRDVTRPRLRARALDPIPNPGHRRGYLRVMLVREGDEYGARLTGHQGSAILRSLVAADGLAVVPGDTVVAKGDTVDVIVLRDLMT